MRDFLLVAVGGSDIIDGVDVPVRSWATISSGGTLNSRGSFVLGEEGVLAAAAAAEPDGGVATPLRLMRVFR